MRGKPSFSPCRALVFRPLLLPLLLLVAGGRHSTTTAEQCGPRFIPIPGDQLLVSNRTHTFASYLSDVAFTGLVPVFVATSVVLQGTYVQDTIEDLATGVELNCGSNKDKCSIKKVYKSNRRADAYTDICNNEVPLKYFSLKVQNDKLRLMVNMQALSNKFYSRLEEGLPFTASNTGGGGENGDGRGRDRASQGVSAIEPGAGFWYDPSPHDGFDPYPQDMTAEDIRREERQQRKARRYEVKMSKKEARAWARYGRWVQKQLGVRRKDDVVNMTEEQYEEYYLNPTNKKFPYQFATDLAGEYGPVGGLTTQAQGIGIRSGDGAGSISGGSDDNQVVDAQNLIVSRFIYDFALILNTVDGLRRLDMTIVPKVRRTYNLPNALLCKPDGSADPVKLASTLKDYIPRTDNCSSHTSRSAPYAIANDTFAELHPEEATWLEGRLDKTASKIQDFVASKLSGKMLNATQARLRVAVANTGGGEACYNA